MIKEFPIPAKVAQLLTNAQSAVEKTQADLNLVAQTVMFSLGIEGTIAQIQAVDSERNVLKVEIPDEVVSDEKPALRVEA